MTVFPVNFGPIDLYLTKYRNQWYHIGPLMSYKVLFPERNAK